PGGLRYLQGGRSHSARWGRGEVGDPERSRSFSPGDRSVRQYRRNGAAGQAAAGRDAGTGRVRDRGDSRGSAGESDSGEALRGVSARRGDRVWPHAPAVAGTGGQDGDGDESGRGRGGAVRAQAQRGDTGARTRDTAAGED